MVLGLSKGFVIVLFIAALALITGRIKTAVLMILIYGAVVSVWRFFTR